MRFGILGPLQVMDGDRSVAVRGSSRRALLGALLLSGIEVLGSSSQDGPYAVLAGAGLEPHSSPEETTDLDIVSTIPVEFVRVRLSGGANIESDLSFLEFSEIVGNGHQEVLDLVDGFTGIWDARIPDISERSIGLIELRQDGVVVTGCFNDVDLVGTAVGNLVHLTGVSRETGHQSFYIFSLTEEGELVGIHSVNEGPFYFTPTEIAAEGSTTECSDTPEPEHPFSCGSTVYGINFDVASATLRPESTPVLGEIYQGLAADDSSVVVIEGHTSSEGSTEYNQELSESRAQAVVDHLVASGLDPTRISAVGKGESELLISPDSDEASRVANRRVEIVCESR